MTEREREVVSALRDLGRRGAIEPPPGAWESVVAGAAAGRGASASRSRGAVAAAALVAVLAGTAAVAFWARDGSIDVATAPSIDPTTTDPTTTNPTTPMHAAPEQTVARILPADLSSCDDLASYGTVSDWLPEFVPADLELDWASTVVNVTDPGSATEPTATFALAAIDDGRLTEWMTLRRFDPAGFELEPSLQAGFQTDADVIDSVRGLPGRVVRTVNRGDPAGAVSARWIEQGDAWSAGGPGVTLEGLAGALEGLDLSGDVPIDPTGRFDVVGRQGSAPMTASRDTTIELRPVSGLSASGAELRIEIVLEPEGTEGLVRGPQWMGPDGWSVLRVDGRLAVRNGASLMTSLPDGAQLSINFADRVSDDDLEQMVEGLRRTEAGDARLADLPVAPSYWEGTDGLCRE